MWLIKRDGLYLMGYQPSGCREIMGNGKMTDILTGAWGSSIRDAKPFDNSYVALAIAENLGGYIVEVSVKEESDHE